MARAQRARAQMALAFETTYGTPPVGGFTKLPFASTSLGAEQPLLNSELLGYGRDLLAPIKDAVTADGDVVVPLDAEAFGFWLATRLRGCARNSAERLSRPSKSPPRRAKHALASSGGDLGPRSEGPVFTPARARFRRIAAVAQAPSPSPSLSRWCGSWRQGRTIRARRWPSPDRRRRFPRTWPRSSGCLLQGCPRRC